jgi:hypothetical protein
LAGIERQAFIDIDSLLRPVYGHAKQCASYGHTEIAGKQVFRKGLSPLAATISTEHAAPVIAGMRLRAGKTGSGKGAGRSLNRRDACQPPVPPGTATDEGVPSVAAPAYFFI